MYSYENVGTWRVMSAYRSIGINSKPYWATLTWHAMSLQFLTAQLGRDIVQGKHAKGMSLLIRKRLYWEGWWIGMAGRGGGFGLAGGGG